LVATGFAAFYVFVHHAFVASVIVFIPDYIVYSDNRGLHRHFSLCRSATRNRHEGLLC
jgi:hypothetical protein